MSRNSETDDEHYEEESMMSHIDDDSTEHFTHNFVPCMEKMELYSDIGSSSMEDMVEYHYDIDSSCKIGRAHV